VTEQSSVAVLSPEIMRCYPTFLRMSVKSGDGARIKVGHRPLRAMVVQEEQTRPHMIRIEGHAIISADGMIANARGQMPAALVFEADQLLFMRALDEADLVVHGRHSQERPTSSLRRRLILTAQIAGIAPVPSNPRALLWNPAGEHFEAALAAVGISTGLVAIIGGTRVFDLFLDRYDKFHLSRAADVRLPGGRPVFTSVPASSPENVLENHGLASHKGQVLDSEKHLTLATWQRISRKS
jgi:hypothetical protein